ncbi:hypothetical protein EGW08_018197 [Elysia chlorotica]|uniref:Uncharacterized protein n=1 Tax=Elysia chlorotica TaxID=188477 RepID=A0A433SXQ0_ELYCH|nr:hypothetical protein EGW08_018197 [Elysia chlorotica]
MYLFLFIHRFSDCLCSPGTERCTISYTITAIYGRNYAFQVTRVVRNPSLFTFSHGRDEGFVCQTPNFAHYTYNTVSCIRQAIDSSIYERPSFGGFFNWNIEGDDCSRCISLCWNHRSVSFSRTGTGNKPEEGRCAPNTFPTKTPTLVPETGRVNTSVSATSKTKTRTTTPSALRHSSPKPQWLLSTPTTALLVATTTGENLNVSDTSIVKLSGDGGSDASVPASGWVGLAIGLTATAAVIVIGLALFRKRNQRAKQHVTGEGECNQEDEKEAFSSTELQPYSCCGDDNAGHSQTLNSFPPHSDDQTDIHLPNYSSVSVDTGAVYNVIADSHLGISEVYVNSDSSNPTLLRVHNTLETPGEQGAVPHDQSQRSVDDYYNCGLNAMGEGTKSGESVTKPAMGAYSKVLKNTSRTNKVEESSENVHTYTTLPQRSFLTEEEQKSVLDTYNMASTLSEPQHREDEGTAQLGSMYSVARPDQENEEDSSLKNGSGETHAPPLCSGAFSGLDSDQTMAGYFTLEDVEHKVNVDVQDGQRVNGNTFAPYTSSSDPSSGNQGTKSLSTSDPQSFPCYGEDIVNHSQGSPPTSGGQTDTHIPEYSSVSVDTGAVYNVIADSHLMASKVSGRTDRSNPGFLRVDNSLKTSKEAGTLRDAQSQSMDDTYYNCGLNSMGEGTKSRESVTKTAMGAYSKVLKNTSRPNKENVEEKNKNFHTYTTLPQRSFLTVEEQKSVLDTYNMASTLSEPQDREDGGTVQLGSMYSVARPYREKEEDSSLKHGSGETHAPPLCSGSFSDLDSDRTMAGYFTLEDVEHKVNGDVQDGQRVNGNTFDRYTCSSDPYSGIQGTECLGFGETPCVDAKKSENLMYENYKGPKPGTILPGLESHGNHHQQAEYFVLEEQTGVSHGTGVLGGENHI